ncbi:MAG: pyridoxamine 5'-phosphate oxidase family protein [bacterium]|nr:pyridoxamine 5'-phosphate oxidase family protein [bacterium]
MNVSINTLYEFLQTHPVAVLSSVREDGMPDATVGLCGATK